ncbi:sensor histidine kinase [Phycisphaera mikurensis]|uniref:Putative two-component system sensor histidine kinase n=1 Tax=Phycisphaera mikurensis (strain NBRC 102666 / KCTC 22515 / FYK2301M01) TaxID=1142394 RepID=I0IAG8_PHYMF|nr:ATP-binding protein [Phycisphaera mikurensis]MBB6441747.1 PAS domain S-box-containing protein [Phycisphaera mikurensis]BAM02256.1 putative two-component system sensor histidine kinase [Phycisphaera mikurensis NBRC 102666]
MDVDFIQLVRVNADGMLVLDEHGTIRHANPAAARLLGQPVEALRGEPFGVPLAPEEVADGEEPLPVEIGIHRPRHPERPRGTAQLRCAPCRWEGAPATLVSLRDVTEHKVLVEELRTRQRRLRTLSAALQQAHLVEQARVSTLVAEAVEQPIRAARAEARAAGPAEAGGGRAGLNGSAQRIVNYLDTALRAAAEAREELAPPALHEGGLAVATRWLGERYRQRHNLQVRVRVEPGFEEPADDRLRGFLFLAVRELLGNVVQHAATPLAEVVLAHDATRGLHRLEVSDRGVGYATTRPHDLDRSSRRPLRGLGLFNLQEAVTHRGGDFRIESGPGEGTRVSLRVPSDAMRSDPGAEAFAPAAAAAEAAGVP